MSTQPADRAAAFFDVDGTITRTDIVRPYIHLRTRGMTPLRRALWLAVYLPSVLRWLWLDRVDRRRMNEEFYRGYAGMSVDQVARAAAEDFAAIWGSKVFPAAAARIAEHRGRGERVVLVTGSLLPLVAPLAAELRADDLLAARMEETNGILSGRLLGPPLAGAEKARVVAAYADAHGIDLARSWAYGDSISDIEVLALVGHPVAVRPSAALARVAAKRSWPVERWR